MEKKAFVARVMGFLKLDDNGKVEAFQKTGSKILKEQIDTRNKKIEEIKAKKEEYETEIAPETVLNVDVDSIKTIEARKRYFTEEYMKTLSAVKDKIDSFEEEIETLEDEVVNLEWMADQMS